jgi:hypothetical protein
VRPADFARLGARAFRMNRDALFPGEAITPPALAGAALTVAGTAVALRRGRHTLRATEESIKTQ